MYITVNGPRGGAARRRAGQLVAEMDEHQIYLEVAEAGAALLIRVLGGASGQYEHARVTVRAGVGVVEFVSEGNVVHVARLGG